jgi:hypothetical protein
MMKAAVIGSSNIGPRVSAGDAPSRAACAATAGRATVAGSVGGCSGAGNGFTVGVDGGCGRTLAAPARRQPRARGLGDQSVSLGVRVDVIEAAKLLAQEPPRDLGRQSPRRACIAAAARRGQIRVRRLPRPVLRQRPLEGRGISQGRLDRAAPNGTGRPPRPPAPPPATPPSAPAARLRANSPSASAGLSVPSTKSTTRVVARRYRSPATPAQRLSPSSPHGVSDSPTTLKPFAWASTNISRMSWLVRAGVPTLLSPPWNTSQ